MRWWIGWIIIKRTNFLGQGPDKRTNVKRIKSFIRLTQAPAKGELIKR